MDTFFCFLTIAGSFYNAPIKNFLSQAFRHCDWKEYYYYIGRPKYYLFRYNYPCFYKIAKTEDNFIIIKLLLNLFVYGSFVKKFDYYDNLPLLSHVKTI